MKIVAETAAIDLESLVAEVADRFTEEVKMGRSPSIEEYAQRHPQIAHIVRQVFPALAMLDDVTATGLPDGKEVENIAGVLGDFRIIRELGRGGMGVVYEAEQISLSRRVALKVLPFASMLDKQQLARFKNEARAAATLDHPNIVAIHSVGCERGVHFYAMQLVDGPSLAEIIAEMKAERTPSNESAVLPGQEVIAVDTARAALSTLRSNSGAVHFQTISRLGIQAAEALDHAHQSGILHRDVKPANLMLDDTGKLWITDFGLARIEADAGMTMTGDLLGTLRYMSPEQTLAKRVVVDHRSDVYSLGATLYELLTLRPPFVGEDRHELLRQIAFEEPRKLRELNSRIPPDLDTIVLKSIEKNPADRYATAKEFADDLRRFVTNEPIKARPATLVQRVTKWSRRHVGVVWSALAVSLSAIVILSTSAYLIAQSSNEANRLRINAIEEKDKATDDRNLAIQERNKARLNRYYAEIVSGQSNWEHKNVSGLRSTLMEHLPTTSEPDNRGWEWYYLQSLCHPEIRTIQNDFRSGSAAYSPDGNYVGAAGRIWKSDSGERIRSNDLSCTLRNEGAWSPDGRKFAWGHASDDDAFYVWDSTTEMIERFIATPVDGFEGSVMCLAWSPDGKQIATGQIDHTVKLWDVARKSILQTIRAEGNIRNVAWSPDGSLLAAAVSGKGVMVWELSTNRLVATLPNPVSAVSWHPNGKSLAAAGLDKWFLLDRADWTVKYERPLLRNGRAVACSPDGTQIAVAHGETVTIWDIDGKQQINELNGHKMSVVSVVWSSDSRHLVTTASDGEIKLWDLKSQIQPGAVALKLPTRSITWQSTNNSVMAIGDDNSSICDWNLSNGAFKTKKTMVEKPVCLSTGGRYAAKTIEDEHTIAVCDTEDGKTHAILRLHPDQTFQSCQFSPDDSKLAVLSLHDNNWFLDSWDIEAERRISSWELKVRGSTLRTITWAHDGSRIAVVGPGDIGDNGTPYWAGHMHVIDVHNGQRVLKYRAGGEDRGNISCLSWSPDGKEVALGTPEGRVEVFEFASQRALFSRKAHDGGIHEVAWHPDGKRIAVGTEDGSVEIITSFDGQPLLTFSLADKSAAAVAWSADGKRLAAVTKTGSAQAWDASNGYEFSDGGRRQDELARAYFVRAGSESGNAMVLDLQRMLALAPDTLDFWNARGWANARSGAFDHAAEELSKTISANPKNSFVSATDRALCLLRAGNFDQYQESCASLVAVARDSPVPSNKVRVAWLCILSPNPLIKWSDVISLAASNGPGNEDMDDDQLLAHGASLYRNRQFDEATRLLAALAEKVDHGGDSTDRYEAACARYFLALARHELGQDSQARRIQALADQVAGECKQLSSDRNWREIVVLDVLRREVQETMEQRSR